MTEAERQQAIREHIEWCEREKVKSQGQIDWFANGQNRICIQSNGEPIKDVTAETVADHRRIIADMDRIIAGYERFSA